MFVPAVENKGETSSAPINICDGIDMENAALNSVVAKKEQSRAILILEFYPHPRKVETNDLALTNTTKMKRVKRNKCLVTDLYTRAKIFGLTHTHTCI